MLAGVMLVGAVYGGFVGLLGPEGVEALNARSIRFAQATVVFSVLGVAMLVSAFALTAGGAYFLFYWGVSRAWPVLGRWGFQLGWYS